MPRQAWACSASSSGGNGFTVEEAPAPSISVTPGMTTANCRSGWGVGGSAVLGTVGVNGTTMDEKCDLWRDVQNLAALDLKRAALIRACDDATLRSAIERSGIGCPTTVKTTAA